MIAEVDRAHAPWRAEERARQAVAASLHEAAAIDLAATPAKYDAVPTDGPVDDVLAARTLSPVPSIHISRAAGRLAVVACLVEMSRRTNGALAWRGTSLRSAAEALATALPDLAPAAVAVIVDELPTLRRQAEDLAQVDDTELVRVAGRAFELGLSLFWVFSDAGARPKRLWDPWRAKQQGCFFTPRFVAAYMAGRALDPAGDETVLDPAVGSGTLLLESLSILRERHGADAAHRRLFGVEVAADLTELTAVSLAFAAGRWHDLRPASIGDQFVTGDSLLAPLDGPGSWTEWFPAVMRTGGFSAVVMNPPYGQLKVNHSSLPARHGDDEDTVAARDRALEQARERAATAAAALRAHPDYRFAHGGIPDLPRFFLERALALLAPGGRLSAIVPSTFLADHRSAALRTHLLEHHGLLGLDLIPEDARLFVDVNQPTCIVTAEAHGTTGAIDLRRGVLGAADFAAAPEGGLSAKLITTVDPVQRRIPDCGRKEAALLARLHEHPRLGDHPWISNLRGELDLTLHRDYVRAGGDLRLVRGDQIERYRSDLATDKPAAASPGFLSEAISSRKREHVERPRVVSRQCSYLRKPRRLSFALIEPGHVVANSCNYLVVEADAAPLEEMDALLFALAVLNSDWLEWRFRLTSSTNHVGNYEIASLPLPMPADAAVVSAVVELARRLCVEPGDTATDAALERIIGEDVFGLSGRAPL